MFPLVVAVLLCPTCAPMHAQRAIHSTTRLADGRVLIAGGMIHNHAVLSTAELFDPASRQFSATGEMPEARMSHSATPLEDGRVLLAGGSTRRREARVMRCECRGHGPLGERENRTRATYH